MGVLSPLDCLFYLTSSMLCHDRNMHDARHSAELLPEPLVEITKGSCSEHAHRKLALALSLHTTNDRCSRSKHLETAVFPSTPGYPLFHHGHIVGTRIHYNQ